MFSKIDSIFSLDLQPLIVQYLDAKDKVHVAMISKEINDNMEKERWKDDITIWDKMTCILEDTFFSYNLKTLQKIILRFFDEKGDLICQLIKTSYDTFFKLDDFMISPRYHIYHNEDKDMFYRFLKRQYDDGLIFSYNLTVFDMKSEALQIKKRFTSVLSFYK